MVDGRSSCQDVDVRVSVYRIACALAGVLLVLANGSALAQTSTSTTTTTLPEAVPPSPSTTVPPPSAPPPSAGSPASASAQRVAGGAEGVIYAFGLADGGRLGDGQSVGVRSTPVLVTPPSVAIRQVIAGHADSSIAIDVTGRLWATGKLSTQPTATTDFVATSLTGVVYPALSYAHAAVIVNDGALYTWGENGTGQLGTGSTVYSAAPVKVPGVPRFKAVATTYYSTIAVTLDGELWTWGGADSGVLGDGTTTTRSTPAPIPRPTGMAPVTDVAAQYSHVVALTSDGQMWAWGDNIGAQLGDGTVTTRSRPIHVQSPAGVSFRKVAVSPFYSMAIDTTGRIWAWGATFSFRPILVSGLPAGVVDMDPGYYYQLYRTSSGQLWGKGFNDRGQLGRGTTSAQGALAPVLISDAVTAYSAGGSHSLAVRAGGTGMSLTFAPDGLPASPPRLLGLRTGVPLAARIPLTGGLVLDSAAMYTPSEIAYLSKNEPIPSSGEVATPGNGPSEVSGYAVYLGGAKCCVAPASSTSTVSTSTVWGVDRREAEILPNGSTFTGAPKTPTFYAPGAYFTDVQGALADVRAPGRDSVQMIPVWADLQSVCHNGSFVLPTTVRNRTPDSSAAQLIRSWATRKDANNNDVYVAYSQSTAAEQQAVLRAAAVQGFDSGRRAAVHADLFGVPKTQAIYLDLEDVNGDKPATYTAARPARDGFAAEASIVLPPMTRAADCLPAALVFIESFDASLAMHGYRGALYSGREFLRNTPSQNLPTLISQAFGVPSLFNLANGLARALVPAGLWVANGTTITTTPTRSYGGNRTYYDQATTLSGFPNPFTVGNTPLAPYRSFSGSQFSFNPPGKVVGLVRRAPKPMLSRGPVSKVTNADCFFPSESNADAQAPVVGALLGDLHRR